MTTDAGIFAAFGRSAPEPTPAAPAVVPPPAASDSAAAAATPVQRPTLWGLDAAQLHARHWASLGVQVVPQGEPSEIVKHAELFLLIEPKALALFPLSPLMDTLNWVQPTVLFVRLQDRLNSGYREEIVTDESDRFVRFNRIYGAPGRQDRVALTSSSDVAQLWQSAPDALAGWRRLRKFIPQNERSTAGSHGSLYALDDRRDVAEYLSRLQTSWSRPDATVPRARSTVPRVWIDPTATVDPAARLIGPVWVGAGRRLESDATVIGPAIVWDDPTARPAADEISWQTIEPSEPAREIDARGLSPLEGLGKRTFDLLFAAVAIPLTLPLYPFICAAIWFEDGRPFFFAHRRETLGGRQFPCIKFRSMRKDAEKMKARLKAANQADGPQFYMENDPRLTRVGRVLRMFNLDELPQFFNVLAGHMSIVGPRASPFSENQYSPSWREARLSVRAGITGLWQVMRTRRVGNDFQEWIKYDLEYVQKRSMWLDMKIIWQTIANILGKLGRS